MGPMEAWSRPMLKSSYKGNWKGVKALWCLSKELFFPQHPQALGEKWIMTGESILVEDIIGLYCFPLLHPVLWLSSQLSGRIECKLFQGEKKSNLYFGEQFAVWRMLPAAAYKSLLTSEDTSGMVSGTSLPPQHFPSFNSNGWRTPLPKARVHGAMGRLLAEEPGGPPLEGTA